MSHFNNAVGSFETRVLVSARKFPELGAGADELPEVPPIVTQTRPLLSAAVDNDPAGGDTASDDLSLLELPARAADAA
jgi:hypothetical protein